MYANSKVPEILALPHDAVGSDGMSVGLFQQQVRRHRQRSVVVGRRGDLHGPHQERGPVLRPAGEARLQRPQLARQLRASRSGQSAFPDRYDQHMSEAQRFTTDSLQERNP
jgi:hypothetical protein